MLKDPLNVVVCGHVDHGKSTLIGRLLFETNSISKEKIEEITRICKSGNKDIELSYLIDQLREERENNITVDTAQVYLKMRDRNFVIIDTPGHFEFIKNMITGATSAQAAILIIDAVEGLKEQTNRHVFVLNMIGIKKIIVVINKMDLVNYEKERFIEIKNNILKSLSNFGIIPLSIIPISAKNGDNICKKSDQMSWYGGLPISKELASLKDLKEWKKLPLRLPIQDVYTIENKKVAVGRIISGTLNVNENVVVMPLNKKAKTKKIKVFNGTKKYASAGENIGIVIDNDYILKRGCIIVNEKNLKAINLFEGIILWLSNKNLQIGEKFNLRCSTQKTTCFIEETVNKIDTSTAQFMKSKYIENNNAAIVKVKTTSKIFAELFDYINSLGRFVLESKNEIKAIGIIKNIL